MHIQKLVIASMAMTLALAASDVRAEIIEFDLNNIASWAEEGSDDNWVLNLVVDSDQQLVGFGYDVTLTTFGDSWLSEATISLANASTPTDSFSFAPGSSMNIPGTDAAFDSGGIISLSSIGEQNIALTSNSIRIEFYESFVDFSDQADAVWNGTLFLDLQPIPAPGAIAMFGLALMTHGRRRSNIGT